MLRLRLRLARARKDLTGLGNPLLIVVVLAGLASFAAPWPVLRRLITPDVYASSGIEEWGAMWGWVCALVVLAWTIGQRDAWMGAGVAWLALTPILFGQWRAEILLVAIIALAITRGAEVSSLVRTRVLLALGWLGVAQALIVLAEWRGYEPLWNGLGYDRWQAIGGTFSHPGTAGAFLALTGIVAPAWMLVVIAPALAVTNVRAGVVALVVGLVLRYGPMPKVALLVCAVALVAALLALTRTADPLQGLKFRAYVHSKALVHMVTTAPVFGVGFGRWSEHKQYAHAPLHLNGPVHPTLNPLHNDALQWVVETGLGGALILAGWLRSRWRDLRYSPVAPALAGALILALTWYPLHSVPTGAVIAALVGLGLSPTEGA